MGHTFHKPSFRSNIAPLILTAILFPLLAHSASSDYQLDPSPRPPERAAEEYVKPTDPEVCKIYLQNLQYYARRNEPMACGQPVAPYLRNKIQPVEWEDLDPDKYPDLFKSLVRDFEYLDVAGDSNQGSEENYYKEFRELVKNRKVLFRRAKISIEGYAVVNAYKVYQSPPVPIQLVQFGINILEKNSSTSNVLNCDSQKNGRRIDHASESEIRLYTVTNDLHQIVNTYVGDFMGTLYDLWFINNRLYGESYDTEGNVHLSQFEIPHSSSDLYFEPVCLYHFVTDRKK